MIEADFTLRTEEGDRNYQELRVEEVPRVGEFVTFDPQRSYRVIDVLWHLGDKGARVTVTCSEESWHENMAALDRPGGRSGR